jgi:hypothetical protein
MEKARLYQVQLLWNARKFEHLSLVWVDLDKANRIAQSVWADFQPCRSCGGGVRARRDAAACGACACGAQRSFVLRAREQSINVC